MIESSARSSKRSDGQGSGKVCNKYGVDWESWRAVPEKIKTHLIDELESDWDIDKSDINLMKCIDNIFKFYLREWKFNVEHEAELQRKPERPTVE
ncbi:hypothetical protein D8674_008494 [Pyrus ussuriensis x Pyrus communis]|uniref:Uncharacterized protein n=1 Tax=Pyrus ussuriensis x Pyrus communis TaxID=2448454 RepID=A0A5N5HSY6_9ROSA|nr:hypothetical protein D8674_008494 [Pyrus ussuriensis x Pyrus communis]